MTGSPSSSHPLHGRRAVVTGAGRGLGHTISLSLAQAGAHVFTMSRDASQLADLADEIRHADGTCTPVSADIRDPHDVKRARDAVIAEAGGADIVVNNAGNNIKSAVIPLPASEGSPAGQPGSRPPSQPLADEEWDSILDTHVRGSLALIRAFVPGMIERRQGRVINIGSSAVLRSPNLTVGYQVAKGTLDHLTRALAHEWAAYGVTVNSIAPGHFRTSMTQALHDSPEGQAWLRERIPMGRTGDARELGALTVHLAGDLASFITGQTIYVDGGETL